MEKHDILKQIHKIGTVLARQATPAYWPCGEQAKAKHYKKRVEALRIAYAQIRNGNDPATCLTLAKQVINNGIEVNKINRLMDKL